MSVFSRFWHKKPQTPGADDNPLTTLLSALDNHEERLQAVERRAEANRKKLYREDVKADGGPDDSEPVAHTRVYRTGDYPYDEGEPL